MRLSKLFTNYVIEEEVKAHAHDLFVLDISQVTGVYQEIMYQINKHQCVKIQETRKIIEKDPPLESSIHKDISKITRSTEDAEGGDKDFTQKSQTHRLLTEICQKEQ
ncbi:unnamed protein product [Rhizophagus irregularis]|nr:unnamed protein product [Rhizophagus irregularis]CAB5365587.1 unnamed protein product [Rhizophagus irregularis]